MVSLITVGVVNFLGLAEHNHENIKQAGFKVNGVTSGDANAAILESPLQLGFRRTFSLVAHLTVIDSEKYKCIIGMDILGPMKAQINVQDKVL